MNRRNRSPIERFADRYLSNSLLQLSLYGMILVFGLDLILSILSPNFSLAGLLYFNRALILSGQIWRALTFPLVYPAGSGLFNVIFFGFAMLIYNVVIRTLEANVGRSRANLFAVLCWLALLGYGMATGRFVDFRPVILGITALAGIYNPNFTIYFYFFIPVKGIVLGILGLGLMVYYGLFLGSYDYLLILGLLVVLNFDPIRDYVSGRRRTRDYKTKITTARKEKAPKHRCTVCGRTEKDAPDLQFRYCSKCHGNFEYCEDHIRDHEHRTNVIPLDPDRQ